MIWIYAFFATQLYYYKQFSLPCQTKPGENSILRTRKDNVYHFPWGDNKCLFGKMPDISCYKVCVLCFSLFHNNLVKHPVFRVRQFNIKMFRIHINPFTLNIFQHIADNFYTYLTLLLQNRRNYAVPGQIQGMKTLPVPPGLFSSCLASGWPFHIFTYTPHSNKS